MFTELLQCYITYNFSYFTCCHNNTNILFKIEYFIDYLPLHTKNKKEVDNKVTDLVNDQGHVELQSIYSAKPFSTQKFFKILHVTSFLHKGFYM